MNNSGQAIVSSEINELLEDYAGKIRTLLADPPWRFTNRTGKMAPEHKRLVRYSTMSQREICELRVRDLLAPKAHLYLWVPNALLAEGIEVMQAWGFTYKTNLVWYKVRKDGGPDRRGVGFYFRNVTELLLFGIRGKDNRTGKPGRTQPNMMVSRKREHSRKPDEQYDIIESCSPGPYLEMFARHTRPGWVQWGNEVGAPACQLHKGYARRPTRSIETKPVIPTDKEAVIMEDLPLLRLAR